VGEREANPKSSMHCDGFIAINTIWSSLLSSVGLVPLTMVQTYIRLLVIATSWKSFM